MTELRYLEDSYQKELTATVVSCEKKGSVWEIVLDKTIFYPQGGGQPSDKGVIQDKHGKATVKHVRMNGDDAVHECSLEGTIEANDQVLCTLDWKRRYENMKRHSGGHIVHEAVIAIAPYLMPIKADHGDKSFIEYHGNVPQTELAHIEQKANEIVDDNKIVTCSFVTLEELQERSSFIPEHLPKHKPLRIMEIDGYQPVPDGGTQVKTTNEVGKISVTAIENQDETVRIYYALVAKEKEEPISEAVSTQSLITELLVVEQEGKKDIETSGKNKEELTMIWLGRESEFTKLSQGIKHVPKENKQRVGIVINQVKKSLENLLSRYGQTKGETQAGAWLDVTAPGKRPTEGHLHIVTQAIEEITEIFNKLGFTRVRHPEVDWDWYAFEALNMPKNHPARDEWETFFIKGQGAMSKEQKFQNIVLTPHTSNGQVREMEKGMLPIRMINIAKCYRRQIDASHNTMFHQFEGLYVDKNVSIGHLKGVLDYFAKAFFGEKRATRIRPFHFQFTEPSFEVDISCGICSGTGKLSNGLPCKLCKEGWLELGGSGMVHPNVLRAGGIDPDVYNGFAFGWGVERAYMMKSGTQLDDIRLLYGNDVRFLEQF